MAPTTIIATPESVARACEALVAAGRPITIALVREHLGGGSLSTIQPLVKAWRARQGTAAPAAAGPDSLPPALALALEHLRDLPEQVAQAIRAAAAEARAAAVSEMGPVLQQQAAERAAWAAREQALQADVDALAADLQAAQQQAAALSTDLQAAWDRADAAAARIAGLEQQLAQREHAEALAEQALAEAKELRAQLAALQPEAQRDIAELIAEELGLPPQPSPSPSPAPTAVFDGAPKPKRGRPAKKVH